MQVALKILWYDYCLYNYIQLPSKKRSKLLRANFCKKREWADSREISDFFIFCSVNLYSELFSKIPFKGSEAL